MLTTLEKTVTLNTLATCQVCGARGIYGKDIVDEDYVDRSGHDSTRIACKDVNGCIDRQRGMYK